MVLHVKLPDNPFENGVISLHDDNGLDYAIRVLVSNFEAKKIIEFFSNEGYKMTYKETNRPCKYCNIQLNP